MSRSRAYIIIGILAVLLLASCGRQYQAKSLVKEYVKTHAVEQVDIESFSDLDSTRVISDSLFQVIQHNAQSDSLFREVSFPAGRPSTTLYFIRMRYMKDTVELSRTFYFDPEITSIIAFK